MRPVGELERVEGRRLDDVRNHLVPDEDVSDQLGEPLLALPDAGARPRVLHAHHLHSDIISEVHQIFSSSA